MRPVLIASAVLAALTLQQPALAQDAGETGAATDFAAQSLPSITITQVVPRLMRDTVIVTGLISPVEMI